MLDGPTFLATLLEWVLGEYVDAFEEVEAKLEEVDVRALEGRLEDPEEEVRRLVSFRRDVGTLHRSLTAHREPIHALTHPELDALSTADSARRFRVLVDRFDSAVQSGRDRRVIANEIEAFNLVAHDEAAKAGARFVDITEASRRAAGEADLLTGDGLHPSARMYDLWARLILPVALEAVQSARR